MFSEPLLLQISSRPLYVAVLFVVLLAFDLVLVRWSRLTDMTRKRSEYIYLGAAALGILSATSGELGKERRTKLLPRATQRAAPGSLALSKLVGALGTGAEGA